MYSRNLFVALLMLIFTSVVTSCGSSNEPQQEARFTVEKEATAEATVQTAQVTASASVRAGGASKTSNDFKVFRVYTDANSPDNHYAASGWMGDWGDLSLTQDHFDNPHSGSTCIKVTYSAKKTQGANWAGIYWQEPANNWGAKDGGYDLTGATQLKFWARGEKGGEKIEEFRSGGIPGEFADSDISGMGPVLLTTEWKEYTMDLTDKDMSSIIGGFMWSANANDNPDGFTIYFDDIRYE